MMSVGPETPARLGILPGFPSACAALGSFTEVSLFKHLAIWLRNSPKLPQAMEKQQMEAQGYHKQQLLCRAALPAAKRGP